MVSACGSAKLHSVLDLEMGSEVHAARCVDSPGKEELVMKTRMGVMILLVGWFVATPAVADVIPPDVYQCNNLSAGDTCAAGKCQTSTCSKLDYSHWDRDASASPPSMTYSCLKCTASGGGSGIGGGSSSTTSSTSTKVDGTADANGPQGSCGCSVVGRTMNGIAPWLLLGALWLPLLRRKLPRAGSQRS